MIHKISQYTPKFLLLSILFLLLLISSESQAALRYIDRHDFPSWAIDAIEIVSEKKIMTGFADKSFGYNRDLTRAEFLTLILRVKEDLDLDRYYKTNDFPDVLPGVWYEEAVDIASYYGWIEGRPDGKFYPGDNLTQAEFAVILDRVFEFRRSLLKKMKFQDLDEESWYYDSVKALFDNNLIRGARNQNYHPERFVTRAEAAWVFAIISEKPGLTGSAAEKSAPFRQGGFSNARRVAIRPRDYSASDKQSYEIEKSGIWINGESHIGDLSLRPGSSWVSIGHIQFTNKTEYFSILDHVELELRFANENTGPTRAFDLKISSKNFESIKSFSRDGNVIFTGIEQSIKPTFQITFEIFIKPKEGFNFYPQAGKGSLYIESAGSRSFKQVTEQRTKNVKRTFPSSINYKNRAFSLFEFDPE